MAGNSMPARLIPPGRILKRELKARGWTQKYMAEIMGRPASKISPIIRGTKQITPETAIELAEALGTSPDLWMNLETNYRLRLAQRKNWGIAIARRRRLYDIVPVSEMLKRGWLPQVRSIDQLEKAVCQFLDVSNLDRIPQLAVSFRGSGRKKASGPARAAWRKRVEYLASKQDVAPFSYDRFRTECIDKLLEHASSVEGVAEVRRVLANFGVHLIFLRHLSRTYLDGAAFYLRRKPVIALTLRYDRIDSFWFTLMHELAHFYEGHRGVFLDDLENEDTDKQEKQANRKAREWLVSNNALKYFIKATRPYFSRGKIEQFALAQRRHPAIILGRLQREGAVSYAHLRRSLLVKVSPYLQNQINN